MSRCIFCGRPANSLEHLWPKWTLKLCDTSHPITLGRPGKANVVIPGPNPEATARIVCKTRCNEGWMARLEARSAPIIKPLAVDLSVPLDVSQQEIVTKWAVKTAMVFDSADRGRPNLYTQEERTKMMESLVEPLLTAVWIGRFASQTTHVSYGVELFERSAPAVVVGFVRIIKVCALLLQVLTLRRDPRFGYTLTEDLRLPWPQLMTQIWPAERLVQWPPARSLRDAEFPVLLGRFRYARPRF
jgi:hypothetical protein